MQDGQRAKSCLRGIDWLGEAKRAIYRVKIVAQNLHVSLRYLAEYFAEELGETPRQMFGRLQFARVKSLIRRGKTDEQIAQEIGVANVASLARIVRRHAGCTLQQLRDSLGSRNDRKRNGDRGCPPRARTSETRGIPAENAASSFRSAAAARTG